MRSVNIAILIFIVSVSLSAFEEAATGRLQYVNQVVSHYDVQDVVESPVGNQIPEWMAPFYYIQLVPKLFAKLYSIIKGAALLGNTVSRMLPLLPQSLVTGLNTIGTISVVITAIQIIRGIGFKVVS